MPAASAESRTLQVARNTSRKRGAQSGLRRLLGAELAERSAIDPLRRPAGEVLPALDRDLDVPPVDLHPEAAATQGLGRDEGRAGAQEGRSEERRVGKEGRSRWSPY